MAITTVFSQSNVVAPSAPPSYYPTGIDGVSVPSGKTSWQLSIDTTGQARGGPLGGFTVDYFAGGGWVEDVSVQGAACGPYKSGSMVWTTSSRILSAGQPYPTAVRFRVDQCPGFGGASANPALASIILTLS